MIAPPWKSRFGLDPGFPWPAEAPRACTTPAMPPDATRGSGRSCAPAEPARVSDVAAATAVIDTATAQRRIAPPLVRAPGGGRGAVRNVEAGGARGESGGRGVSVVTAGGDRRPFPPPGRPPPP